MAKRHLNPNLVFYFEDGELVVNNYDSNEQFTLERDYFECLWRVACGGDASDPEANEPTNIESELEQGGLIGTQAPRDTPWGWDVISRIFHLGTQYELPIISREERLQQLVEERRDRFARELVPVFSVRDGTLLALPAPTGEALRSSSLGEALEQRTTCRDFKGESVALQTLSDVIYGAFGLLHGQQPRLDSDPVVSVRRAYPSGGNVHAEEVYVVAYRVDGLPAGLYHYQPREHALNQLQVGDFEQRVVELNNCQYFSEGLAFGIYLTARLSRSWWKYPISRAYRMLMMDIGHAAQTFMLVATAHGLQTWQTGAFDEVSVNEFIGLEGDDESTFMFLGCGHGTGEVFPADYRAAFASIDAGPGD